MTLRFVPLALIAAAAAGLAAPSRAPAQTIPDLKVETYKLPNGLSVILHEDHTTPTVSVNIWYKVGSKNEAVGRTGFAHLFEHLMFQGSEHHDDEYFGPLEKLGATINGSTSNDRTNYFEALPSNALELALYLEADRMGFLLPALSQAKLDNQRDVVKNERRQRVDNVPYGQAQERILEALYPADHPYHHSVIGSMADLSAASLADVSAFFRTYYSPNNASLAIAGDINPAEARKLVEKLFGPLPAGPEVAKLAPNVPKLDAPKHLTMTDAVQLARTQLVWPTVALGDPDEAALDTLATILGQLGNQNRLFLALQYDKPLATQASAGHITQALAGTFNVSITPQKGQNLDDLIAIADREIERLKAEGPTAAEVQLAKNLTESRSISGLQAVARKSDFLNSYNVNFGDPLAYKQELERAYAVTAADVQRVAKKYLGANRVRMDVTPGKPTPRPAEAPVDPSKQAPMVAPPAVAIRDDIDRNRMPTPAGNPEFSPAPAVRRKLSNGLEVLIAERHNLPIVGMNLIVKGGATTVAPGKEGLASLAGSLMTEGTASRDAVQLARDLAELGASLDASGGLESSGVSMTTLTRHLPKALEIFTDVVLHPSFPEKDLERLRAQRLAALLRQADSPTTIAGIVFPRLLYGADHPYGRTPTGTPKTVKGLTRDDVVAYHRALFVPNNAALIVAGDVTPDAILPVLEAAFKGWQPGSPVAHDVPDAPAAPGVTVALIDRPGAAQSVLAVGEVGVARSTPDYFPLTVMNSILGGQFTSRINLNLREAKGYTYGARSSFGFRQAPGPFEAGGSVHTDVTAPALTELVKELTDIAGPRTVTDVELANAKDRAIKGFPARFETVGGLMGTLSELVLYNLPPDFFTSYRDKVDAVSKADVDRVAARYLHAGKMTILVVGDRSKVEEPIRALPFAKDVKILDPEGNPVPAPAAPGGPVQ